MNNQPQQSHNLDRDTFLFLLRRILEEPRSLSQLHRAIDLMFRAFTERDRLAAESLESEKARKRAARWDDPKEATLRLLGHGGPDFEVLDEHDGDVTSALERLYDPNKHPRGGFIQNRGWYSRTWGSGGTSKPARQAKTQAQPQPDSQTKPKFQLVSDPITKAIKDRNKQLTDLTGDPAFTAPNRRIDDLHDFFTFPGKIAHAAVSGLLTGTKAVVNGAATAVRSVATLGLNTAELELIGVTKEDRANGYNTAVAIATASGQVLIAVGTGGLAAALAKGGTIAKTAAGALVVFDAAGNAVGVVQGVADAKANGFNLRNGLQIAAGALGLRANAAALAKVKAGAAGSKPAPVAEKPAASAPANGAKPATPGTSLVPSAPVELGRWGEARLAHDLGGRGVKPTKSFKTSLSNRFVDRLVDNVAHEAKAGKDVALTSDIRTQALKDAELIKTGKFDGVVWHFYRGVKQEVLDFLDKHGIRYVVH